MRIIKQIFLTFAITIGLSLAVCAQKDDQKRPPKNPPVVNPGEKPPKGNPPKGEDKKPKKPGFAMEIADKVFLSSLV
jgi:hypothetical protein